MKVAVIGSRGLTVSNLVDYLPCDTTEIISGGAKGVDTCARDYALSHGMERIGGILQPMYDLIISNRIENRKLAALRDTILPQLMSGELDVSDLT